MSTSSDSPELQETFEQFKHLTHEGVSGVLFIDSGRPGPCLGITACTHGNEPAGLAVFHHLLSEVRIEESLLRGSLYLVVNNIKATDDYFAAKTDKEEDRARWLEVNMNRLPKDAMNNLTDERYEVTRARKLYPIWKRFTFGMDIHSTLVPMPPMIISRGERFHADLMKGLPIEVLISNIDAIQIGKPAFAFYGGLGEEVPVFAIEAGQHTQPESMECARASATALLQNLGMLAGTPKEHGQPYREYKIDGSIVFSDMSFDFLRKFETYDAVSEGDLLATNAGGAEIRAPFDGHLILPTTRRGKDKEISEEVAFLSRPVQLR